MSSSAVDIVRALLDISRSVPHGDKLLRDIRDLLSKHVGAADVPSVVLISPSGDEPQLLAAVSAMAEKKYGQPVEVTQKKDASLIGGAVLQIGDEQIDLSVRGSLNDLEAKLRASPIAS